VYSAASGVCSRSPPAVPSRSSTSSIDIDVRDSGIGTAPDKLEHIFEPFVQLGSLGDSHREGIGLGLSISRTFARLSLQAARGAAWMSIVGIVSAFSRQSTPPLHIPSGNRQESACRDHAQ
jgi:signal transduction histidine kinase